MKLDGLMVKAVKRRLERASSFRENNMSFYENKTKGVNTMVKILHSDAMAVEKIVGEITRMEGKRPRVKAVIPAGSKETIFTITVED